LTAGFTFSDANQYKAAELCYREASPEGMKILYYVDYEYPGHDSFYAALASMSLLPSTTVVHGDNAMEDYLANEGWHLVVSPVQAIIGIDLLPARLLTMSQGGARQSWRIGGRLRVRMPLHWPLPSREAITAAAYILSRAVCSGMAL
jgi:hypothetical protein